jgi:hypothetical protein
MVIVLKEKRGDFLYRIEYLIVKGIMKQQQLFTHG